MDCGRRFGKTILAIDRLAGPALEGYPVAYFAPTYRMLSEVWREVKATFQPITTKSNAQDHRIELLTSGVIEMWSLDTPDVARGRKYKRALVDEAAMIAGLRNAWQAVIRPTLTDFEGDAWFFSTPRGRNYFGELWERGQDPGYPEWASWKMPTSANPFIKESEIEAARRELPERIFAQEYLAEFIEDGGGVFRRVMEAATATAQAEPEAEHVYVLGVDWGKHQDFTVLSLIDATTKAQAVLDRFNQIDYALQVPRLQALCQRFRPVQIVAEQNSMGVPLVEQLHRAGLPVVPFLTTNATKAAAIDALSLAFEQGALQILNDPVQLGELLAYEAERLPSGLLRYGASDGMHDDTVMALALAWQGCASRPQPTVVYRLTESKQAETAWQAQRRNR